MIVFFANTEGDLRAGEVLTKPVGDIPRVDIKERNGHVHRDVELGLIMGVQGELFDVFFNQIARYVEHDPLKQLVEVGSFEKFLVWMTDEMRKNRYKGDKWRSVRTEILLLELYKHVGKLHNILANQGSLEHVKEFCADIANLAYMTHNQYEGHERQRRPSEVPDDYGILGSG